MRATSYHENGRHTPTSPRKTATILTDKKPLEQGEGEPIDVERNQEEPREQGSSMRGRESLNRAVTFQSNSEMETSKKKNENKTQQGDPSFGREGELSDSPAHSTVLFASYERGALLKKKNSLPFSNSHERERYQQANSSSKRVASFSTPPTLRFS